MSKVSPIGSIDASSIPVLETDRLHLRAHRLEDLGPLAAIWAKPDTTRFIGNQTRSRGDMSSATTFLS